MQSLGNKVDEKGTVPLAGQLGARVIQGTSAGTLPTGATQMPNATGRERSLSNIYSANELCEPEPISQSDMVAEVTQHLEALGQRFCANSNHKVSAPHPA